MGVRAYFREAWQTINHESNRITPYLGLRSRVSQVWVNRWTILLLLVLVRTLIAISSIDVAVREAELKAMEACSAIEASGNALASMPHYMAQGANQLTQHGVEKAVDGLIAGLGLSVTAVEELVVFGINLVTQTYLCLITMVITGSLHAAIEIIEDVGDFVNKTVGDIGRDIHSGVDDFEKALNGFIGGMSKADRTFGGKGVPSLNIDGSLDKLDHIQIPSSMDQGLSKLNASIPTFAQVNNFTNNAIRLPFEELKDVLTKVIGNYTFDKNEFPVPAKQNMGFCSAEDAGGKPIRDFFQGLIDTEHFARKLALIIFIILAIVVCIPETLRVIYGWKSTQDRAQFINDNAHDPVDVIYLASRPYTSTVGVKLSSFGRNLKQQTLIRWVIAYATSLPALFILSLGIAGFFAALVHYLVLVSLEKSIPGLENEVGNFSGAVMDHLNNASLVWANGTNAAILGMNHRVNNDVLGWVNKSTIALNDTLNVFVDETMHVLNETFGGTVLYDPVKEVFNCLIGLKIAGIERGLTWAHDHAHIDFPQLPNDTFSAGLKTAITTIGDETSNSTSDNSTLLTGGTVTRRDTGLGTSFVADPDGTATSKVTKIIQKLVQQVIDSIKKELIISGVLVGGYVLIVLIGIGRAIMLLCTSRGVEPAGFTGFLTPQKAQSVVHADDASQAETIVESKSDGRADSPTLPRLGRVAHNQEKDNSQNPFADPTCSHPAAKDATLSIQATPRNNTDSSAVADHSADRWRGQEYTLRPNPLPNNITAAHQTTFDTFSVVATPAPSYQAATQGPYSTARRKERDEERASRLGPQHVSRPKFGLFGL